MYFKKVVIIGMGLIGGSIGKALINRRLADEVVGVCRRKSSLKRALREKALTEGFVNNYSRAVIGADLIIIATPVHTVMEVLDALAGVLSGGKTLVTDVGSTKKEIVRAAAKYRGKFNFIGGHPLAGSEKAGVEYSSADLFDGSVCVLTPVTGKLDKTGGRLRDLWKRLGVSTVCVMRPEKHDSALAFSSHLPHLAAYALVGVLDESVPRAMFSTGFKSATRIASSDAVIWSDIFMSNRRNVIRSIRKYKKIISSLEKDISDSDPEALRGKLERYKRFRDELVQES
jgi:prephenate dehydrogenase